MLGVEVGEVDVRMWVGVTGRAAWSQAEAQGEVTLRVQGAGAGSVDLQYMMANWSCRILEADNPYAPDRELPSKPTMSYKSTESSPRLPLFQFWFRFPQSIGIFTFFSRQH